MTFLRRVLLTASLVVVALVSRAAGAAISVQVGKPTSGSVQAGPLDVATDVTSTFQLQSVVAQVETVSVNLTYLSGSTWTGSVPLTSLSIGPKTLTVTATDVYGATASSAIPFRYRQPPRVVVDEPVWAQVVGSTFRVRATCIDENPSTCTVRVGAPGPTPPTALEHFDGIVDARPGWMVLYINVTNDAGQTGGGEPLDIYSAASLTGLRAIGCAPGQVLDFDASRLLYRLRYDIDLADRRGGGTTLLVQNIRPLFGESFFYYVSYLGSNNVLFAYDPTNSRSSMKYDVWRAGSTLPEAEVVLGGNNTFAAAGDRFVHVPVGSSSRLVVTNLTDGTDIELPNTSVTAGPLVITPSGTVYYSVSGRGGVVRWKDGVVTPVTDREWLPVASDDVNLVVQNDSTRQYSVLGPQGSADGGQAVSIDQGPILAAGGWLAFSRVPDAGPPQVWSRSPAGVVAQVSFFGAGASAEALSDTGEVAMRTGNGERWIGRAGSPPSQIAADGTIRWRNGQWYVNIARMLYRLDSSCTTDDPECGSKADAGPFSECAAFGAGDADASADPRAPRDASVPPSDAGDGGADNPTPPGASGCGGCRLLPARPHGRDGLLFVAALAALAGARRHRRRRAA